MPKRIKHEQNDDDPTGPALAVVRKAVGDESFPTLKVVVAIPEPSKETIRDVMAALGRRGGPKGAAARAAKLSPRRRKAIARKAAAARWRKAKNKTL